MRSFRTVAELRRANVISTSTFLEEILIIRLAATFLFRIFEKQTLIVNFFVILLRSRIFICFFGSAALIFILIFPLAYQVPYRDIIIVWISIFPLELYLSLEISLDDILLVQDRFFKCFNNPLLRVKFFFLILWGGRLGIIGGCSFTTINSPAFSNFINIIEITGCSW